MPHIFIYLFTLFNVDYKTLVAYELIKIDYPSPSNKKHNKNVNKSVKEENRLRMQFFQITIHVECTFYIFYMDTFRPCIFQFPKNVERRTFSFFRY